MAHNTGTDRSGDDAARQGATILGSVFDPAALRVLQEAFDMAWTEAVTLPIVRTDEQGARDFIAERIVRAARMTDEHDTQRLKTFALQAFETPAERSQWPPRLLALATGASRFSHHATR